MSSTTDIVDLVTRGVRIGTDLFQSLAGSQIVKDVGSRVSSGSCGCAIPPPCWMPKALGLVRSDICAGGTATVRLLIENCGPVTREITVEAAGADAGDVKFSTGKLSLGPMEQARVTATVALAATAASGEAKEALIWVRGCHDHYLRWSITAARSACNACHEVEVEDCPDYVHHWYDHFYCNHPCPGGNG